MLYSVAAVLVVVAIAGATFVWCTADASASAPAAPGAPAAETTLPPPTTSSTTSSTTTSTSTSTSTTLKPKPVTTTAKPRPVAPATTPPTAPPATAPPVTKPAPVALPGNFTAEERCANARQWVAQQGLALPAGWGFRCPGQAVVDGAAKWGMACWNCNGDGQSWIAVDIGRIGASDKTLRYVIAHEICHAIDFTTLGISTELGADLCAATHGAPR